MRQIIRSCSICEAKIKIALDSKGKYSGGHYFGKLTLDQKKFEYWECNKCNKK